MTIVATTDSGKAADPRKMDCIRRTWPTILAIALACSITTAARAQPAPVEQAPLFLECAGNSYSPGHVTIGSFYLRFRVDFRARTLTLLGDWKDPVGISQRFNQMRVDNWMGDKITYEIAIDRSNGDYLSMLGPPPTGRAWYPFTDFGHCVNVTGPDSPRKLF